MHVQSSQRVPVGLDNDLPDCLGQGELLAEASSSSISSLTLAQQNGPGDGPAKCPQQHRCYSRHGGDTLLLGSPTSPFQSVVPICRSIERLIDVQAV